MKKYALLFVITGLLFAGCESNYIPKPKGFLRLDMPKKNYVLFDSLNFPYSFYMPDYVRITADEKNPDEPYWIDLNFKPINAVLYLSYKKINKNLDVYLEDSRTFVNKHIPKASAINEKQYINEKERVFGLVFNIEGNEAASPLQFYLTDSTQHFLRAALYFNFTPNNDSLAPVIDYIKQDVNFLIESLRWKPRKNKRQTNICNKEKKFITDVYKMLMNNINTLEAQYQYLSFFDFCSYIAKWNRNARVIRDKYDQEEFSCYFALDFKRMLGDYQQAGLEFIQVSEGKESNYSIFKARIKENYKLLMDNKN